MKRRLLPILMAVCCLAMAAQALGPAGMAVALRNPQAAAFKAHRSQAPHKALGENQLYMGAYAGDAIAEPDQGIGFNDYPQQISVAAYLPVSTIKPFNGGEVKAIRFGLCAQVENAQVFLIPVTKVSGTSLTLGDPIVEQDVAATQVGWNEIAVDGEAIVSTSGVTGYLLGYSYEQNTTDYPIAVVDEGETTLTTYVYAKLSGSSARWQDVGISDFGNLCVQAIVESESFPDYKMSIDKISVPAYAIKSEGLDYSFTMSNFGVKTLDDYDLEILVDDEPIATLHAPVPVTQVPVTITDHLDISDYESGVYTITVHCVAINGQSVYIEPDEDGEFTALTAIYPRQRQLVEHFTSQYCTYCPLGENVLKHLDALRGDLAWVSIHGNMSSGTDVFTISKGNQVMSYLDCSGFPTAAFNRYDALGDGELCQSIGYYEQYADQAAAYISETWMDNLDVPALATVDIKAHFDAETRQLDVTVSGQSSEDFDVTYGSNAALTVYLTEDGLVGRQLNQGVWYDEVIHNHVLRNVLSSPKGDAIGWGEDYAYENKYTVSIADSWNIDNMHLIAFLSRTGRNKTVINAELIDLATRPAVRGDIDGNDIVDVNDLSLLIDVVLGNARAEDMPGDCHVAGGTGIDVSDVSALIDIVLGNTSE